MSSTNTENLQLKEKSQEALSSHFRLQFCWNCLSQPGRTTFSLSAEGGVSFWGINEKLSMAPFSQVTRNQQWFLITGTEQANKHRAPYEITNDGSPFFSSHNWDHQCYENYFHLFLLTKYAHQSQPSNLDFLCSFVYGEKKSLILKYYSSRIRNTQIKTIMIYHLKKKKQKRKTICYLQD